MGDAGALKRAVRHSNLPHIRQLVKGGVSVNQKLWYGTTLLQEAVTQAHVEMVKFFLEQDKRNLNDQNDDGKTALHIASRAGQETIVELLLAAGAQVDIQCLDNTTALHLAMWKNKEAVVGRLIAAGADPNLRDQDHWVPLHWGVHNGSFELVKQLVNCGAKTNVVSKVLMTPLTLSVVKRHLSITRYLLLMGAGLDLIEDSDRRPLSLSSLLLEPELLREHYTEVTQLVEVMAEHGGPLWLERKTLLAKHPAAGSRAEQLHRILVSRLSPPPTLQELCRFFLRRHLHHTPRSAVPRGTPAPQPPPASHNQQQQQQQHHHHQQQQQHHQQLYIDRIIALKVPRHLEDFLLTRSEKIRIACRARKPPPHSSSSSSSSSKTSPRTPPPTSTSSPDNTTTTTNNTTNTTTTNTITTTTTNTTNTTNTTTNTTTTNTTTTNTTYTTTTTNTITTTTNTTTNTTTTTTKIKLRPQKSASKADKAAGRPGNVIQLKRSSSNYSSGKEMDRLGQRPLYPAKGKTSKPKSPHHPNPGASPPYHPHPHMSPPHFHHACMSPPHPGMSPPHPGMTPPHPGMTPPHPGMTPPRSFRNSPSNPYPGHKPHLLNHPHPRPRHSATPQHPPTPTQPRPPPALLAQPTPTTGPVAGPSEGNPVPPHLPPPQGQKVRQLTRLSGDTVFVCHLPEGRAPPKRRPWRRPDKPA
ncbi:hypothetical protein Ahia01_000371700 [Argonauta hians]